MSLFSALRAAPRALALAALVAGCAGNGDLTIAPTHATPAPPPAPPPAPLPNGRLPDTARPTHYALSLLVDPKKDRFSGDVTIDVDVPRATSSIVLHARGITVLRAEVTSGAETVAASAEPRMSAGGREAKEELVLSLARPISFGNAQIHIAYSAPFADDLSGAYRVVEGEDAYVFTMFEPTDARRMLPCFDEPGFKVPFDVKITTPNGNLAVANTKEASRHAADDGRSTTFVFATTAPLPTYLLAMAVGPLEIREGQKSPVPIRLITTKGKSALGGFALESGAAMVKLLGEYFDRPYPYDKLDLVAVPEFADGAMENAGLITFREELLLLDAASASTDAQRGVAETVAHEIAHHWFGNLVTMKWWDDLWLNEGFATWIEGPMTDRWRPDMAATLERLGAKEGVMETDALDSATAIRQPVTSTGDAEAAFDGIAYYKGASVIGMLERWLGEDTFRAGVRSYIKAHEHRNATAADLLQALGNASGRDVALVASSFLDQPGVPLVRAELVCDKDRGARVELSQSRYRARKAAAGEAAQTALWKLPVCVSYEGAEKGAPACQLMDAPKATIALPGKGCPKYVYPNAGESGYYRFALPPEGLSALGRAGAALPVAERVGLVANAWSLVQSGDLRADVLLDMLAGMKRERSRLVLEQMIQVLRGVDTSFVDDASRPAFRAFASSLLLPVAKELGWDRRKTDTGEQKLLRKLVFEALGTLADDPWLRAEADRRTAKFFTAPRSIDADTAPIALRVSTRHAGSGRVRELVEAVRRGKTPEDRLLAVRALGSFESPELLRKGLDAMLEDPIKVQDGVYLFEGANDWAESRPVALAWVRERFSEVRAKVPGFVVARFGAALELACTASARDEAGGFFRDALKDVDGADRALEEALEDARECIDLRAREGERARKRLRAR